MKLIQVFAISLALLLAGEALPAFSNPRSTSQSQPAHFISLLKGNVQIRRSGRKGYQKAQLSDSLHKNDRLRVARGAKVTVLCSNLKLWQVPAGKELLLQKGCPTVERPFLQRPGRETGPTRSGDTPNLPYLISPRSTKVLRRQPLLRWNDIGGPYQVRVWGDTVDWSTEVKQAQVAFPGDQQKIQSDFRYRVEIVAKNGASNQSELVSFEFLSEAEAQQVQQEAKRVQQLKLSREAEVLAMAYLYQRYDLKAEAIEQLKPTQSRVRTAATLQLLGDLYWQSGLARLADTVYREALLLAKQQGNREVQAQLEVSLATVNEALAQLKLALGWLRSAHESYRVLGDGEQVKALQLRIDNLSRRLPR